MELSAQVVLVTGSSRGLGAEIARAFAAHGARVVINYKASEDAATELARSLDAVAIKADITSPAEVNALFAQARQHYHHPITTIINNALVDFQFNGDGRSKLDTIEWEAFNQQLQGSLRGALNTIKAATEDFGKMSFGRIVNIGSNLVQHPVVPYHDYTAAKAALLGFTRTVANELGPQNVTCNMVSGGLLRTTDASRATPEDVFTQIAAVTPMRRVMTPADVAAAVLFFASPWASGCTGQNINVDGGLVMS